MKLKTKEEKQQLKILPGQLTPDLDQLYSDYVHEVYENADLPSILDLIKMYRFCPINRVGVEFKAMRAVNLFGKYSHPDKKTVNTSSGRMSLTAWMLSNFQTMQGNLSESIAKMFRQTCGFGYSVAEVIYSANVPGHYGEWRLCKINVLNPCNYRFAGRLGEWDRIIYRSTYKSHYAVPRQKLIHMYIPSIDDPENPLGDGQGVRGYTYYLARNLAIRNWNSQLAKGVKGLTIIKADSNATVPKTNAAGEIVTDAQGNPIPISAVKAAGKAASQAKDGDTLALDKSTEVQHFAGISGTGADYNLALQRYSDDIMLCYGIPKTIFQEGSAALGQAGLNAGHNLVIDNQILGLVQIAREQFVEQIVKDLLRANFGITQQSDYGEFKADTQLPPEQASMRITNLMSAMLQGVVDPSELEAINRIRQDIGLSTISEEDFQIAQMNQILRQQQNSYVQEQQNEATAI